MIYELGGEVGVDPGPLTLRKLIWMVDARRMAEWDRTAAIRAEVYNKENTKPLPPRRFNPYRNLPEKLPRIRARQMGEMLAENKR